MGRIVLVYGVIAGAIVISSIAIGALLGSGFGKMSERAGYLIMLAALSAIFMGIKRYRDVELGGVIRFPTALGVGLGIALVSSVIYVLGWEIYLWLTHYTFFDAFAKATIAAKRADGASAAELTKLTSDMAAMGKAYAQPLYRMFLTLFEILPVGIVITLVSAALLCRSAFLPAKGLRTSKA